MLCTSETACVVQASSAVRSIGAFKTAADVEPVLPVMNLWQLLLLNKPVSLFPLHFCCRFAT